MRLPPPIETLRGAVLPSLVVFQIVADGLAPGTLHKSVMQLVSIVLACVKMDW